MAGVTLVVSGPFTSFWSGANLIVSGMGSFSGNNNDEGLITNCSSSLSWTSDYTPVGDATGPVDWAIGVLGDAFFIASGNSSPVEVSPTSGGATQTHAPRSSLTKPVGNPPFSSDLSQQTQFHSIDNTGLPYTFTIIISTAITYDEVRVTSLSPATPLDLAGGQLCTLTGLGFSRHTVTQSDGSIVHYSLTRITFNDSVTFDLLEATDITVLDNGTVTFRSPANPNPDHTLFYLNIWFTQDENPFTESPGFPINTTFDVMYTATRWWFNPTSGHYRYAMESPGAPFVSSDPPVPTITGFHPRST